MQLTRRSLFLLLFFVSAIRPIYGNPSCDGCDPCGDAYSQGSWCARWSAYIPIAAVVAAAIWFGVADGKSSDSSSSSSDSSHGDGLGCLSSRRSSSNSHRSYSSGSYHSH